MIKTLDFYKLGARFDMGCAAHCVIFHHTYIYIYIYIYIYLCMTYHKISNNKAIKVETLADGFNKQMRTDNLE